MTPSSNRQKQPKVSRPNLLEQLQQISTNCSQCGICVKDCAFLTRYGNPKRIADNYDPEDKYFLNLPFECSLCDLCTAVCPHTINPSKMFLEMRREAFERGEAQLPQHRGLRRYEKTGTSKQFTWYAFPENCDTIFFPGCALTGSRPQITLQTYALLQKTIPNLGIVLDCCTKPSHDLGDSDHFNAMFGEMKEYLQEHGIETILTACPNCLEVFTEYGEEFNSRSIYDLLNETPLPETTKVSGTVSIHDPCVSRYRTETQDSVRQLLTGMGLKIEEPAHSKQDTLCCGAGAGVGCLAPEKAEAWTQQRVNEADGHRIVSYCASCTHTFGAHASTSHLLDLIIDPEKALLNKVSGAKAPLTYLNRLRVKKNLQRNVAAAVTRERTFSPDTGHRATIIKKLGFLTLLTCAFFIARSSGVIDYLEPGKLQTLIQSYGALAPIVYMLIYTIAPSLFLPGLPIGIVGGILFGPLWGVIYTIISATMGACLAFLISRYLARDLIERRLKGSHWQQLEQQVEKNGWKMVALTRLVPLFPFNLLNYAFGLTGIKLSHYALATFIFMLPGCIAFITFSSSLPELMQGHISPTFMVGLALVIGVSLSPVIYKWFKKFRGQPT
ncbi:VTT domain-containing protein [uncultured Desulfuromusa sp.]|uniref:VTT domain-containing protein n=1 Tax=uncultured Desulfuromusa sp. TaxID=219183 RepID=UPI002AA918DB|nr:VTT domain-containing protein [uncultured Desulfuromusa sp.]